MVYKCYIIAQSLSQKEWLQFCKSAMESRYKSSPDFIRFIVVIENAYPKFLIKDEEILQEVYQGTDHNPSRLRVLRTYLKHLIEDFIINQELKKDDFYRRRILIEGLKNRNCIEPAITELKKGLLLLSESEVSLESLEKALNYEEIQLDLFVRSNRAGLEYHWKEMIQSILNLGLAKKLRLLSAAAGKNSSKENQSQWYESAIQEAKAEYRAGNFENQPYIQLFYHVLSLINHEKEENHYQRILTLIKNEGQNIEKTELKNVFALLINFFTKQERYGVAGSLRKAFDTYQEMYRQNLVFGNGVFSERVVRIIVTIGARLREIQWTEAFLEEAYFKLPESNKDNIVNSGKALILFIQKRYSEAKVQLSKMAFMSPLYRFYHDLLLMRICYETSDFETFDQIRTAFKRHLSRKAQIAAELKNVAINFATAIHLLIEFQLNPSAQDIQALREKIQSLKPITHSEWLEEKISELEHGKQ